MRNTPSQNARSRNVLTLTATIFALSLLYAAFANAGIAPFANTIPTTQPQFDNSMQLARVYAPILRMHHDERFLPQGVEALVDNAVLKDEDDAVILPKGSVTLGKLGEYAEEKHEGYYLDIPDDVDTAPQPEYPVKLYATIQEGRSPVALFDHRVYLQYWLFYYFDDLNPSLAQDLCKELYGRVNILSGAPLIGGKCVPHEADWELIQLEFDANGIDDILDNDIKPDSVSYSRHYWSEDREWKDTPTVDRHPIAYVSQDKHANYFGADPKHDLNIVNPSSDPSDDDIWSISILQDRISDRGKELLPPALSDYAAPCLNADPDNHQVCTYTLKWIDSSTSWVAFQGKWGDHKVEGPDDPVRWERPYTWAAYGRWVQVISGRKGLHP